MERLLRFDKIRLTKLFEMIQAGGISLLLSIYIGTLLDKLCGKLFETETKLEDISSAKLIFESIVQFSLIIITAYYIGKLTSTIPLLFSLTDKYVSNQKNEVNRGVGMGTKILFFIVQKNLVIKTKELSRRAFDYF